MSERKKGPSLWEQLTSLRRRLIRLDIALEHVRNEMDDVEFFTGTIVKELERRSDPQDPTAATLLEILERLRCLETKLDSREPTGEQKQ